MSNGNEAEPLGRPGSVPVVRGTAGADRLGPQTSNDTCQDSRQDDNCQEISGTWNCEPVDNHLSMGKAKPDGGKPRGEITIELRRFIWLVAQLRAAGIGQAEMARRTGIESSHINRLANAETHGYTGLSADIVRKVRDGLNISPDYFFDQYEDERPAMPLYSLDQKRRENWSNQVDDRLAKLEQAQIQEKARISELEAALYRKDAEIERLKHELAVASRRNGGGSKKPR